MFLLVRPGTGLREPSRSDRSAATLMNIAAPRNPCVDDGLAALVFDICF